MTKKNKGKVIQMLSPENYIRQKARTLPIDECWINSEWKESTMANILVSRRHTNGNLTIGMYLVDLNCLGVKDAVYWFNNYEHEFHELLRQAGESMKMEKISYVLAHNVIYTGIEFAEDYGFKPHKNFTSVAQYILEEDTEEIELMEIECGFEGKPLYARGPLDDDAKVAQVIAQLEKTAGPGNYIFIENEADWDELEDWDDDDAWDEPEDDDEAPGSTTFQFKVQLNNIKNPPVWRRIQMPADFTFYDFHEAIQTAFGWSGYHLFQFSPNGFGTSPVITEPHEDDDDDENSRQLDADAVLLSEIFVKEKQHFSYIYDFGDTWEHKITLEKIIPESSFIPDCIDGKGKCPPEDCGGVWGFENFKKIMADKKHPEYKETAKWIGLKKNETWDPAEFDFVETSKILSEEFGNEEDD